MAGAAQGGVDGGGQLASQLRTAARRRGATPPHRATRGQYGGAHGGDEFMVILDGLGPDAGRCGPARAGHQRNAEAGHCVARRTRRVRTPLHRQCRRAPVRPGRDGGTAAPTCRSGVVLGDVGRSRLRVLLDPFMQVAARCKGPAGRRTAPDLARGVVPAAIPAAVRSDTAAGISHPLLLEDFQRFPHGWMPNRCCSGGTLPTRSRSGLAAADVSAPSRFWQSRCQ